MGGYLLVLQVQLVQFHLLTNQPVQLHCKHGLSNQFLEGVGAIQAVHTVRPDYSILELKQLLMRRGGGIETEEQSCAL